MWVRKKKGKRNRWSNRQNTGKEQQKRKKKQRQGMMPGGRET